MSSIRSLILLFLFVFLFPKLNAQPALERITFERDKVFMTAYAFKIDPCEKDALTDEWKAFVKSYGGKSSVLREALNRYKADDVQFESLSKYGPVTMYFEIFPHDNDSLIVANAFQFYDGAFIDPIGSSPQNEAAEEIMKDLSYRLRQSCLLRERTDAIDYRQDLVSEKSDLQNSNSHLEKEIAQSQNRLVKLERDQKTALAQKDLYERKLQEPIDDYTQDKIKSAQTKVIEKEKRLSGQILKERADIEESEIRLKQNKDKIERINIFIKDQDEVLKHIEEKLNKIIR